MRIGSTGGASPELRKQQRLHKGRDQRNQLNRRQLGQVRACMRRFDPIAELLSADADRIGALLPIKYARMLESPFSFFRGSVAIMAADLGSEPHSGLLVQMCGDAHIQNLGSFEAPDGRQVFDINDFDETLAGPWEWDVKRMATSLVLAGYESNHGRATCTRAVAQFVASYCKLLGQLAEEPVLTAVRHPVGGLKKAAPVAAAVSQAVRATPHDLLTKYTVQSPGKSYQFRNIPSQLWRITGEQRKLVLKGFEEYKKQLEPECKHWLSFYEPVDIAFKVVGTGSIGCQDYVMLLFGNGSEDPLFLQFKEERASIYSQFLPATTEHQGKRVAEGQKWLQPLSDLMLGWTTVENVEFVVRQMNDHKGAIGLATLKEDGLQVLSAVAGQLLARGHARSGDALQIKGYIGSHEKVISALTDFALEYAGQVQADFELFRKAVQAGQIPTQNEMKKPVRRAQRSGSEPVRAEQK